MAATFRAEIGPCDDDAYFFMDGTRTVALRYGQERVFQRDLEDGNYSCRLLVINSGGWAWGARIRLVVNGTAVAEADESGGSGFYTGPVFDRTWNFRIRNGQYEEF